MKCEIQWIDADGKPTPDTNEAAQMAHFHESKWSLTAGGVGNQRVGYTDKIQTSYPICQQHLDRVSQDMRFENGGAWTFSQF